MLFSAMIVPLAGAGPLRVTVPVEEAPPTTLAGFSVSIATIDGTIVRGVVRLFAP